MALETLIPLVLASASPRRRELLATLGLRFEVHPTAIEETPLPAEAPEELVMRLARAKSACCLAARPGCLVLAADTVVAADGTDGPELLGKPEDGADARRMLHRLSGTEHRVLTAMVLVGDNLPRAEELVVTRVRFATLSPALLDWYVSTDEPYDKAGAYGIQGCAALFVSRLEGSWSNVVGLPLERLATLFETAGHDLTTFLRAADAER